MRWSDIDRQKFKKYLTIIIIITKIIETFCKFLKGKMDIEFIEEEHRDNIYKIMELCNCDMAEAYELYNNNGCNV